MSVAEEQFITVMQMADRLCIGRTQAYELVTTGVIPSLRIGRLIRISVDDLRAWIRQQKAGQKGG